ncbi:Crp/Fnr family transcriptional regulator [Bacillus marinisedimentorum]|uniref:Crp/Fnr family transcriptional regulator n=1 Tax=Bacillus marinisedimentorum TaxID=1821260 RepID=UPI0008724619|nr:Crp/Fnr family transcriptional regulator [Bacillus marinisedimentorum]
MNHHHSIKSLLQKMHIFKELSDTELDPILNISYPRQFKKRTLVFMQGDPLDKVYFIYSGSVKIYKTDMTGKEQIVSILQAGDMFPHVGFFRKGDYPGHAEILEDATLIVIPIEEFENIIMTYPDISIKLFRVLGEKIVDLQNRLEEQILSNSYEQIIKLLLRLSKNHGVEIEGGKFQLTTNFTNREMANMIGTSRETVSRTLNGFKKNGIITIEENGFFIIDSVRLKDELIYG